MIVELEIHVDDALVERENLIMDDVKDLIKADGKASVSAHIGFALDFSKVKASVSVRLACDQNEASLNQAKELAVKRAIEFTDYAMDLAVAKYKDALCRVTQSSMPYVARPSWWTSLGRLLPRLPPRWSS